MKIVYFLVAVALFTASFDNFLTLHVVGTIRIAQLAMLLATIAAIAHVIQNGRILWPRGGTALLLWLAIQAVLVARSGSSKISIQLLILTVVMLSSIYVIVQLFGASSLLPRLMKAYLKSYVFVAIFSLYQFVSPALHLGAPLITQWIKHGLIPRINGFNYEPSFFATYMAMGWIMLVDLRTSHAAIVSGRPWRWAMYLTMAVLILSTSKTAYLFMMVEAAARLWPFFFRVFTRQARRLVRGSLLVPLPRVNVVVRIALLTALIALGLSGLSQIIPLRTFLSGTGLGGTAAHSLNDRSNRAKETLAVLREHPLIGVSQGGVAEEIALAHGATINGVDDLRLWWGFPVPLEALAASGLLGFIPLLWFFLSNTIGQSALMRQHAYDDRSKWLHALIRAFVFELLLLLADQNLLRIYFWFHVTMMVVVGYHLRYYPARRIGRTEPVSAERLVVV